MIYIVTVNFNDDKFLKRTIDSVRKYKLPFHKFIIIDGGSIDQSMEYINDNIDIIDWYISEKDNGIYDAMNKITKSDINESDFVIWINSGDELIDWTGKVDINYLEKYDSAFFSVIAKSSQSQSGILKTPRIFLPYNEKNFFPKSVFYHQGFIVKYKVFFDYLYDLNVGIQAENLLMSKIITSRSFFISSEPLSIYYLGGISNQKYYPVLKSYLKVALVLDFNLVKIAFYKLFFIVKLILLIITPKNVIETVKRVLYDKK